jgi:hypothetical protein
MPLYLYLPLCTFFHLPVYSFVILLFVSPSLTLQESFPLIPAQSMCGVIPAGDPTVYCFLHSSCCQTVIVSFWSTVGYNN